MKINGYNFTFGADPEGFIKKKNRGEPVSAYGMIEGTKDKPFKVKNGAVQVDGMAVEFNIDPAKTPKKFSANIESVKKQLLEMVPDYEFHDSCVAKFGKKYIDEQPEMAKMLGCEPDYNAYTGEVNPVPDVDAPFRTAAGHVHIGWQEEAVDPMDPGHFKACRLLTKALDFYLGVPSIVWDDNAQRRKLYGKAGAFRPKSYGMEYRTLSNRWVKDEYFHHLVFDSCTKAIKKVFDRPEDFEYPVFMGVGVRDIINDNNVDIAKIGFCTEHFLWPSNYRERFENGTL